MSKNASLSIKLNRLLEDQRGAGMTEYIILVGVIAILALAAFEMFGGSVKDKIETQSGTVDSIADERGEGAPE